MLVPHNNISVFIVDSTINIKYLSVLILDVFSLKLEELEPSSVSGPHLEILGSSGILDVEGSIWMSNRFDGLGLPVQVELLGSSVVHS